MDRSTFAGSTQHFRHRNSQSLLLGLFVVILFNYPSSDFQGGRDLTVLTPVPDGSFDNTRYRDMFTVSSLPLIHVRSPLSERLTRQSKRGGWRVLINFAREFTLHSPFLLRCIYSCARAKRGRGFAVGTKGACIRGRIFFYRYLHVACSLFFFFFIFLKSRIFKDRFTLFFFLFEQTNFHSNFYPMKRFK